MTETELLARESIRHTLACYTMAGDRLQIENFIAVFTDNAILETDGVPEPDAFRHIGRAAIHTWINRWREHSATAGQPVHQASVVRHHLSTCLIEFVDDNWTNANARTYWTAYTDIGPDHGGCYIDQLQHVDNHWLIAHRKIRLDWRSPNSLMYTAINNTR